MARTTAEALDRLQALLVHPDTGVNTRMSSIEARDSVIMPRIPATQIVEMNLSAAFVDENMDSDYPAIYLFGDEAVNENQERFSWFSGTISLGLEVRVSADRPDSMESTLHRYVESVLEVLQDSQGEWSAGLIYSGRYSVRYSPITLGGANFLQVARFSLVLEQFVTHS